MSRSAPGFGRRLITGSVLGASCVGFGACQPSGEAGPSGSDGATAEASGSTPSRPANLGEVLRVRGDTVELKMDEYIYGLPSLTLPAGRIVFQIQNLGFEGHNLEILQGDSLVASLEHDVSPAEIRFFEVTLEPGEYQFVCTVSGHDSRGMLETVTIVGDEDGGP